MNLPSQRTLLIAAVALMVAGILLGGIGQLAELNGVQEASVLQNGDPKAQQGPGEEPNDPREGPGAQQPGGRYPGRRIPPGITRPGWTPLKPSANPSASPSG